MLKVPGQFVRESATFDVGNLGCSKSHHYTVFVLTEIDIESMEGVSGKAHSDDFLFSNIIFFHFWTSNVLAFLPRNQVS